MRPECETAKSEPGIVAALKWVPLSRGTGHHTHQWRGDLLSVWLRCAGEVGRKDVAWGLVEVFSPGWLK